MSDEIQVGDIFYVGGDAGQTVKMRLVKYLNEYSAEVEILSGPEKGKITILEKELD